MFKRFFGELGERKLRRKLGKYFLLSLILFVSSSIIGYKLAEASFVKMEDIFTFLGYKLYTGFDEAERSANWGQVLKIFFNNSIAAFKIIFLGLFLGFGPVLGVFLNGFFLGVVLHKLFSLIERGYLVTGVKILPNGIEYEVILCSEKTGYLIILTRLLPHGIIEVPALLFAAALGFYLAEGIFREIKRKPSHLLSRLKLALFCFVVIIVPALFLAAIIEVFISGSSLISPF